MSQIIEPSVGRIVHYQTHQDSEVAAAIVVRRAGLIPALQVFSPLGTGDNLYSPACPHASDPDLRHNDPRWSWPERD